jgi:glycosyltransferase involved in cell wall biosynthesis
VLLSVVLITYNEEANLARTLASVQPLVADGKGEIIVVDSLSTDRTVEIAKSYNAKVFIEDWKGFAAQKNSAIDKAEWDWILSLDADEELESALVAAISEVIVKPKAQTPREIENVARALGGDSLATLEAVMAVEEALNIELPDSASKNAPPVERRAEDLPVSVSGYWILRKNFFLGRWIKHGGYYPDPKLRLFRRGYGRFENRLVHEDIKVDGLTAEIQSGALLHHSYPTISDYIEHMNRYSSLGAEMTIAKGPLRFPVLDIFFRPILTFIYNYIFRLGFLDGHEGFLLHVNHAIYVSWKYAKAWELEQTREEALTSKNNTAQ